MQRIHELEFCHREMFGDLVVTRVTPEPGAAATRVEVIRPVPYAVSMKRSFSEGYEEAGGSGPENERRRASALVDELLVDIYNTLNAGTTDYNSTSGKSHRSVWAEVVDLHDKGPAELTSIIECLKHHVTRTGSVLVRQLKRRDALTRQQEAFCDVITRQLAKRSQAEGSSMRFSVAPAPTGPEEGGESGFTQWAAAMKMVAQLPGGIPPEFRRRLWLTLAERHLAAKGVDWASVERTCFSEWSQPADGELGVQIVKDLHRTGCSLFCGERGQENQALLKRVLLAYARWNKAVGYCQGFNMLAALMLQVTERSEGDALKLMVYLIEGVLPESYFADSLRGLSVDMAVFRELLRGRLPQLARHLDALQSAARDGSRSYEPPLTNVFTMQWFLTLFCNCLPQATVLRVWDLILLEGDEVLLRAALAIWRALAPRVARARTADEFYCAMGSLTRDLLSGDLLDANELVRAIVEIGPLGELATLREHYLYNIHPWGAAAVPRATADRQLRRLHPRQSGLALDIGALKKQYAKLRQRQRQARVIFGAAVARQAPPAAAPIAINHLLLGKSALAPARRLGPPKGTIPPARQAAPSTLHWKDANKRQSPSSSSSSDTELCDEEDEPSSDEDRGESSNSKPKPTDNLPQPGDSVLMKTDNTISAETSVRLETSGTGETATTEDNQISNICDNKLESDSDGESFDFEQFLADRVKCLGSQTVEREEEEEETDGSNRISYARRNSTKALQIIQENSLILHRILQCQSRLSPSPPTVFGESIEEQSKDSSPLIETERLETSLDKMQNVHSWINSSDCLKNSPEDSRNDEVVSPQYGSKYTSILEKSKSLDERYNSLILNSALASSDAFPEKSKTKSEKFSLGDLDKEIEKIKSSYGLTSSSGDHKETEELNQSPMEASISTVDEDSVKHLYSTQFSDAIDKTIMDTTDFLARFMFVEDTTSKPSDNNTEESAETFGWNCSSVTTIGNDKLDERTSHALHIEDDAIGSNILEESKVISPTCYYEPTIVQNVCANDFSTNYLDRFKFLTDGRKLTADDDDSAISITSNRSNANPSDSVTDPSTTGDKNSPAAENASNFFDNTNLFLDLGKNNYGYALEPSPKTNRINSSDRPFLALSPGHSPKPSPIKELSPEKRSPSPDFSEDAGKSPSKLFNPFPVPLSSRQSKEVPYKLGLYKK